MTKTAIINAKIFDGLDVIEATTVVIEDGVILSVGDAAFKDAVVIDAKGGTLLPGLIDAHTHTSRPSLALALKFGVTTELEMQGANTKPNRGPISEDDSVADVRSSGFAITPPGGHPAELFPADFNPAEHFRKTSDRPLTPPLQPFSTTPEQAVAFIPQLIASGSDYIKFMIDDGCVEGHPGIPMLDQATLNAGVAEAHKHGMMTVAHVLTIEATQMALDAGIDGLAHIFMDKPHTPEIIENIVASGIFICPCVVLNSSMMGITGEAFSMDPRVNSRLPEDWLKSLRSSFGHFHDGNIKDVLATVKILHDRGVRILAGTDVSMPLSFLGGLAHGASLHHELQYLVEAGLTPIEALRAATSTSADCYSLNDRGRIRSGLRADLLLVSGDPTVTISDTLNLQAVWRRGTMMSLTQ